MAKVFISYKRKNSTALAHLIWHELKQQGIEAFLDTQEMEYPGPIPELLRNEIKACDIVLCLLSNETLLSGWVREEIEFAYTIGKVLIPVFQESYEPISKLSYTQRDELKAIWGDPVPEYIQALLNRNGVQIFDQRGLYVSEALELLIRMLRSNQDSYLSAKQIKLIPSFSDQNITLIQGINPITAGIRSGYGIEMLLQNSTLKEICISQLTLNFSRHDPCMYAFPPESYTYQLELNLSPIQGGMLIGGTAKEPSDTWARPVSGQIRTSGGCGSIYASLSCPFYLQIEPNTSGLVRLILKSERTSFLDTVKSRVSSLLPNADKLNLDNLSERFNDGQTTVKLSAGPELTFSSRINNWNLIEALAKVFKG